MVLQTKTQENDKADLNHLETSTSGHGLFWIMVKSGHQNVASRNKGFLLRTCTFFHTTECAKIPRSIIELLRSLLRTLEDVWTQNRIQLKDRLMKMVSESQVDPAYIKF